MRAYSMRGVQGAADRAVALTREYLIQRDQRSQVHDVQHDPRFQHRGVDLLWDRGTSVLGVEVKGDRQAARRGNYFFELVSNLEKNTPGCFLYSVADLLAYVFVDRGEVHCLELPEVRAWFLGRAKSFPLRSTHTRTGAHLYTTVGALVPVRELREALPQAVQIAPR